MTNTQKFSIRLLREDLVPADAVREGVDMTQWDKREGGAMIGLHALGGSIEAAGRWTAGPRQARACEARSVRQMLCPHCLVILSAL